MQKTKFIFALKLHRVFSVSYTHLDVYKRQIHKCFAAFARLRINIFIAIFGNKIFCVVNYILAVICICLLYTSGTFDANKTDGSILSFAHASNVAINGATFKDCSEDVYKRQLSVRLLIVDLVGRYPTNYLIRREPILRHLSFRCV